MVCPGVREVSGVFQGRVNPQFLVHGCCNIVAVSPSATGIATAKIIWSSVSSVPGKIPGD